MMEHFNWLFDCVPLWAFLLALGTSPLQWSGEMGTTLTRLFQRLNDRLAIGDEGKARVAETSDEDPRK